MTADSDKQDNEKDSFEDAQETAQESNNADATSPSGETRTRSLTDRRTSTASPTTPKATGPSSQPADSPETEKNKKDSTGKDKKKDDDGEDTSPASPSDDTKQKPRPKSPLLTTRRLSTSSLDEVNLTGKEGEEGDKGAALAKSSTVPDSTSGSPSAPPSRSSKGSIFQSFSPSFPSAPWSSSGNKNPPQTSAPPSKKLSGPFSWLSRGGSGAGGGNSGAGANGQSEQPKPTSAPAGQRRNTAASASTISSNPELLGRLHEGSDADAASVDSKKQKRSSLKDQFKALRLRGEGGHIDEEDSAIPETTESPSTTTTTSPPNASDQLEPSQSSSSLPSPAPTSPLPSTVNPNLAPGTVSGISAAASDAAEPVNWELWQDIVNNGPEALRGSNAEELNAAFKRGIPQTIRGVIWQILADSRNAQLEEVYRELSSRGPEQRDRLLSTSSVTTGNGLVNGSTKEKESEVSSRSSIHSENSAPPTTGIASPISATAEKDGETVAKAQAALEGVRRKKAKDEVVALQKLEKAIRRDLGSRTSYSKYFLSQRNQDNLFGLCKAYALYDEGVGYAQGINFIVMPLLFNMDEGDAFALLVKLMNQYGLRNLFIQDMPGLHLHLYQFERLLEDLEPALSCHLRRRGVLPELYATQWFLTLFAYRFPLQLVLRIYDLVFGNGLESTILRFAVAIMRRNKETLLGMNDMSTLTQFLKEKLFDVYIDQQPSANSILESGFFGMSGGSDKEIYRADIMVEDACSINLSAETIKTYTSEWEEKTRVEKEQAAELEGYKSAATTQASRIRVLEEQAEKSDKEHVQLASELVRLKVENEELKDSNESYKGQVEELKSVVDRQPQEVEEKLKTEMDRIMKRNIEVQNENRSMEEQMATMEKELVEVKMRWAELSENHESLKQKWYDMRKAFDD